MKTLGKTTTTKHTQKKKLWIILVKVLLPPHYASHLCCFWQAKYTPNLFIKRMKKKFGVNFFAVKIVTE